MHLPVVAWTCGLEGQMYRKYWTFYCYRDLVLSLSWERLYLFYISEGNFRGANFLMFCAFIIFGTQVNIRYGKVCTSFHLSLHSCVIYLFWTYSIISWWCWMHAFSLSCKSRFAVLWTCSLSCPSWGVKCCCLISKMAAFSLSNWVQAIAINTITRGG